MTDLRARDTVLDTVITVTFLIVLVLLFLIGVLGCGSTPKVIERPIIVPKVVNCTDGAVPVWEPVAPPKVCVKGFQCYATPEAAKLAENIDAARGKLAEVAEKCGGAK